MVKIYADNIEKSTLENHYYRRVIATIPNSMQLVLMRLEPQQDIGMEVHPRTTQFIRVEQGEGIAQLGSHRPIPLQDGSAVIIPPEMRHNIINTSTTEPLLLYTIYTPPEHPTHRRQRRKPREEHHHK